MYTFSVEKFADIYDELEDNYRLYIEETDLYHRPMKVNKKGFEKYEELGLFVMFTIRFKGELVGNCGVYIAPSMHTEDLIATEDFLFIRKDHRGGELVFNFVKYIETELFKKNIDEIFVSARLENKTYRITDKLGYKRVAYQCVKHS